METTKKFDGRASDYAHSRPQYATALLDHLYDNEILSPASTVADIGSGTGKFSRQLLDRQSEVYCVEPNADMRSVAKATLYGYPRFHSIAGEATHTTLASGSVDFRGLHHIGAGIPLVCRRTVQIRVSADPEAGWTGDTDMERSGSCRRVQPGLARHIRTPLPDIPWIQQRDRAGRCQDPCVLWQEIYSRRL